MSAAVVLYTINANGNLKGELSATSGELEVLAVKAEAAKRSVAGMDGASGRAGSTMSELREGFNNAADEAEKMGQAVAGVAAVLGIAALGANELFKTNDDWAQSVARLTHELGELQDTIGDTFGPTASTLVDNFNIGLAFLVTLIVESVKPAVQGFHALLIGMAEDPKVKALLDLFRGDFAQAAIDITLASPDLTEAVGLFKQAADGLDTAYSDAIKAAKGVYDRINDGMNDIPGKSPRYQDKVTQVPGLSGRGGYDGSFASPEGGLGELGPLLLPLNKALVAVQDIPAALANMVSALAEGFQHLSAAKVAETATGVLGGLGSGSLGGLLSSVAGGPIGVLVAAIADIGPHIDDAINSNLSMLLRFGPDTADAIDSLLTNLPTTLGRVLPAIIVNLLSRTAVDIAVSVLANLPGLLLSVLEGLFLRLPIELAQSFGELFDRLMNEFPDELARSFFSGWSLVRQDIGAVLDFLQKPGNAVGDALGIHLGAQAEEKRFLGIRIPSFDRFQDSHGVVTRSGLAMVHKGESIGGRVGGSGGGVTIGAIHLHGVQDVDELVRQIRRRLGVLGVNLSLEPRGG